MYIEYMIKHLPGLALMYMGLQRVHKGSVLKKTLSDTQELWCTSGNSIFGPILYCLYAKSMSILSTIIRRFGLLHILMTHKSTLHKEARFFYADKLPDVGDCVSEIKLWMEPC